MADQGVQFHCLEPNRLERFLERRRARPVFPLEMSLVENLTEVLRKANQFVPSAAGSILLDDPIDKVPDHSANELTFIAAFGNKASGLVGRQIPADKGIAGFVYRSGRSHFTSRPAGDPYFYDEVDELTHYQTQSLVAIPIRVEHEVCGVLELINRRDADSFNQQDCYLLEVFADYISISIQNVLDGRQAQEIAKRDNLTGLYNDRFLHVALARSIERCRESGRDLALVFLDLDYFKRVNDAHGHLAGSQVLSEVGRLLASEVESPEALVCRYGGDEFVVAMPGLGLDGAVDLAESVRTRVLNTRFCSGQGEIHPEALDLSGLTCSIGIATLHRHIDEDLSLERSKSALLRLADSAMYVAKETGRNRTAVAGEPVRRRGSLVPASPQREGPAPD